MSSPPTPPELNQICVVLVEPQLAINVGTVIRALKNMGLTRLRLVGTPSDMDLAETQISAHRSLDVVDAIEHFQSLDDAVSDCHLVLGSTARSRRVDWMVSSPRERAPALVQAARAGSRIAIVFGRERTGLTNEEIDRCDELLSIPTRPDYSSLNLAQAVLLISYELFLAAQDQHHEIAPVPAAFPDVPVAEAGPRRRLVEQVGHTLDAIRFFKSDTRASVLRKIGRIFARAQLDDRETRLMTGIFVEVLKFAELVERGVFPTKDLPANAHVILENKDEGNDP